MATYYASPTGSATGSGAIGDPWDLAVAFDGGFPSGQVNPGDTIYLRGGVYTANGYTITANATGSAGNYVTFQSYPGEWAHLQHGSHNISDEHLTILGTADYILLKNIEISNTNTDRTTELPAALWVIGDLCRIINCVFHDASNPITDGNGTEFYGCVSYNIGFASNAHGLYLRNGGATVVQVKHNILVNNANYGAQWYAEEGAGGNLVGLNFEENVLGNNGSIAANNGRRGFVISNSGSVTIDDITLTGNVFYVPNAGVSPTSSYISDKVASGGVFTNNWFIGGGNTCHIENFADMVFDGNTMVSWLNTYSMRIIEPSNTYVWDNNTYWRLVPGTSFRRNSVDQSSIANWRAATGYDTNGTLTATLPTSNTIKKWVNAHEAGRATYVALNWTLAGTVDLDVSGVLTPGDTYEIRNGFNYMGTPIAAGTYSSGSLTVNTSGLTVAPPVGLSTPAETGPVFNVYVVRRTTGEGGALPFITTVDARRMR